jgi:hypothetical protein
MKVLLVIVLLSLVISSNQAPQNIGGPAFIFRLKTFPGVISSSSKLIEETGKEASRETAANKNMEDGPSIGERFISEMFKVTKYFNFLDFIVSE